LEANLEENPKETQEKTEELIKELLEDEKDDKAEKEKVETQEKVPKSSKSLIFLFLIIIVVLLLIGGLFTTYKILTHKKEVSESQKVSNITNLSVTEKKTEEEPPKKKAPPQPKTLSQSSTNYPYRLELKNFLFPLNENTFLKCDIYIYFKTYEELKIAYKNDLFLRKFFTEKLKNIQPLNLQSEKNFAEYQKKLLEDLKKTNTQLNPAEIEIEPILLKV
jgi:hypothetical protein